MAHQKVRTRPPFSRTEQAVARCSYDNDMEVTQDQRTSSSNCSEISSSVTKGVLSVPSVDTSPSTSSSELGHTLRQAEIIHILHISRPIPAGVVMTTTASRTTASTIQSVTGIVPTINPTLVDHSAPPLCDQEHAMNTLTQVVDEYYEMMVRLRAITGQETPSTTDVIKDEPGIEDEPEIMDEPQIEDEPEIMYSHYYMVKYLSGMRHLFDNPKEEGNKEKSIEKEDRWQREVSEYDDVIPSSVQRDKCLVDWTWVSEKLHRRLSIDRLLHSSTSMSSPSSSIDLYTPEMCRQLWRIYFYTKLDICGAYDPLYEVKGKLTKLHFLQVKNQPKGRVTRDTAVQFTVSEISAAVGLTSSLTLLRRENEERFRRFGIWNEDEYGLLRKGMAAYRCLLENLEELRRVSRLDQQLDVVMGRPLDPYNDDAEDDFSGTYSLAAEMTAVWTKTWWPNSKEDVEEFRSRLGRRADDEYDWDWIRVRYVPWRRLNEIKLQVFMMRFGSQVN